MPHAVPSETYGNPVLPEDDLDNLFNYDDDVADFRRELDLDNPQVTSNPQLAPEKDVDAEIKQRKRRAPIPKLDENRLESRLGIPKLHRISKQRLKFRGKGHEFTDMARLLNTYQLWLDDLYPRAKFRDALALVEKVGHSKKMQVKRRAWIDESKPRPREPTPEVESMDLTGGAASGGGEQVVRQKGSEGDLFGSSSPRQELQETAEGGLGGADDARDGDELDALLNEHRMSGAFRESSTQPKRRGPFDEQEPDEDELDALMAEDRMTAGNPEAAQAVQKHAQAVQNSFDVDEEEAMADMGGFW